MEKIIVNNNWRTIIYDTEKKIYKKSVRLKFREKLKVYLGFKRAQGYNANYISKLLNKNGIKTYKVISYTKYNYVTEEVKGKTLIEKLLIEKDNKIKLNKYLDMYMEIVAKVIKLNLCYTDFNFNNIIVNENEELVLIDIDEMQDTLYCKFFKNKKVLFRLKKTLKRENDRLKGLGININLQEIYEKFFSE